MCMFRHQHNDSKLTRSRDIEKSQFRSAILKKAAILNSKGNFECLPFLKCSLRFQLQLCKAAIRVQKMQYTFVYRLHYWKVEPDKALVIECLFMMDEIAI